MITGVCDYHHLDPPSNLPPELGHVRQERGRVPPALRQGGASQLNGALVRAVERPGLPKLLPP